MNIKDLSASKRDDVASSPYASKLMTGNQDDKSTNGSISGASPSSGDKQTSNPAGAVILVALVVMASFVGWRYMQDSQYKTHVVKISTGYVIEKTANNVTTNEETTDDGNVQKPLSVVEGQGFDLVEKFAFTGEKFRGVKIVMHGPAVSQDLVEALRCSVKTERNSTGAWPERLAADSYVLDAPSIAIDGPFTVSVTACAQIGADKPKQGTADIELTFSPMHGEQFAPVTIKRSITVHDRGFRNQTIQ